MQSGAPIFVALGVSGVLALAGIGLLTWWLVSRRRAAASQSWPSAQAQMTTASIHTFQQRDNEGTTTMYHEPKVEYTYTVGGQTYTGKRIAFGAVASTDRSKAEQALGRYTPSAAIDVYYNPQRPQDAVLERTVSNMTGPLL